MHLFPHPIDGLRIVVEHCELVVILAGHGQLAHRKYQVPGTHRGDYAPQSLQAPGLKVQADDSRVARARQLDQRAHRKIVTLIPILQAKDIALVMDYPTLHLVPALSIDQDNGRVVIA